MMKRTVRIGRVADQDGFRRDDVSAMSPSERLTHLILLRDLQFGDAARRIRDSGIVSYRTLPTAKEFHASRP